MRALLREFEANQLAILFVLLGFLVLLLIIYIVASALFDVDGSTILGLAGMGTGSHVSTATNQALQARSPNYTPMAAAPYVPWPAPAASTAAASVHGVPGMG